MCRRPGAVFHGVWRFSRCEAAVLADGGATVEFDRGVSHFNCVLGTGPRSACPVHRRARADRDTGRPGSGGPVALESFADTPTSLPLTLHGGDTCIMRKQWRGKRVLCLALYMMMVLAVGVCAASRV